MTKLQIIIGFVFLYFSFSSCTNIKKLQYLQGSFDTSSLSRYKMFEPRIQNGDLISILVFSDKPEATSLYNQSLITIPVTSSIGASSSLPSVNAPGYLVDGNGDIQFQGLGRLHIGGLTKQGLVDLLNSKLKDTLLFNPYYSIRFLNYKITIIGDVAKPGIFSIPTERVNLLEALGLAGDLNITARRDNIRIIREQDGIRTFGMVDLRSPDILNSPYYQLRQNDIIYVDLTQSKADGSNVTVARNISIAATVVSTFAIIYSIFRK